VTQCTPEDRLNPKQQEYNLGSGYVLHINNCTVTKIKAQPNNVIWFEMHSEECGTVARVRLAYNGTTRQEMAARCVGKLKLRYRQHANPARVAGLCDIPPETPVVDMQPDNSLETHCAFRFDMLPDISLEAPCELERYISTDDLLPDIPLEECGLTVDTLPELCVVVSAHQFAAGQCPIWHRLQCKNEPDVVDSCLSVVVSEPYLVWHRLQCMSFC
jgi:hypothetical protein